MSTHGVIDCRIDPLWWNYLTMSHSSQFSTASVPKAKECTTWDGAYKSSLAANERVAHDVAETSFLSHNLNGPLQYVRP